MDTCITLRGSRWTDAVRLIRLLPCIQYDVTRYTMSRTHQVNVHGVRVCFTVHSNGLDPQLLRRPYYSTSNLTAALYMSNGRKGAAQASHRFAINILSK